MKNQRRSLRENGYPGDREPPARRKVAGKAAKHALRVAAQCEKDAENYDALAAQAAAFQAQIEAYGSMDKSWGARADEYKAKAEESRQKADAYRKRAM